MCGSREKVVKGRPGKVNNIFQRFNGELDSIRVVRCSDCSGMYVSPMIYFSDELLTELYNIRYFDADMKNMGEKYNILRIVEKHLGSLKGKMLLDIGCGTGEYLKAASDFSMDVTGIDVDESLAANIRKKYGYKVRTGLFGPGAFPRASFDVIVLSHVIEHLQEPSKLLECIRHALKSGGLFVMCTPNADSLMEHIHNIYGKLRDSSKTYYLTPFISPYHILGFNLKSSRRILERTGFTPVYCKVHSGLEWEDANRKIIMRSIKVAGAVLGKGMSIVTVSQANC
jgi:2-polyprenyl-3-methyl-5-hydroxy-6-metoxy-1,4-benzoquinol methylase